MPPMEQDMPQMGDVPPMQDNNAMGNGMPPIDNGMPPQQEENQFDTNFDAGVEADEQTDPKKYIQQLTGKLSQSLRSYNEGLPQPDADLDKYVAGMIIKQAIAGLSQEDANDILNKVKSDDDAEEKTSNDDMEQPQNDEQMSMNMDGQEDMNAMQNNMGESISKSNKQKIDEIFNQIMNDNDEQQIQKPITNVGYRKKPFTSPNFK